MTKIMAVFVERSVSLAINVVWLLFCALCLLWGLVFFFVNVFGAVVRREDPGDPQTSESPAFWQEVEREVI